VRHAQRAASREAVLDRPAAEPDLDELPVRDDAVLLRGDPRRRDTRSRLYLPGVREEGGRNAPT